MFGVPPHVSVVLGLGVEANAIVNYDAFGNECGRDDDQRRQEESELHVLNIARFRPQAKGGQTALPGTVNRHMGDTGIEPVTA